MVLRNCQENLAHEDIYCDLPEFDRLQQVPNWSPEDLINIYNVALVQGLLFYADSIEITVKDTEPAALRKFMRRLKFYRLLAEVKRSSQQEIRLILSGPAAVFGENRKYGLQLAAFFPVILLLKNWKLRAELKLRDGVADVLNLDSSKCELKSALQRWAAYVPEEVKLFIQAFRNEVPQWRDAFDAELPRIANTGTIFPDFSFEHAATPGRVIHLELFHRCNNHALEERLEFLEKNPDFPLVVGIDRTALGKNGEKLLLEKYKNLAEHAFFFSNYPGVERVKKMLNKIFEYRDKLL
jgi:predicted nuclease of restriction endonuclease-like RecB superfamily